MSPFTQKSFGDVPGCVGADAASYIKCIVELNDDESKWEELRNEGISYIKRTHSRNLTSTIWSKVINDNFKSEKVEDDKNHTEKGQDAQNVNHQI